MRDAAFATHEKLNRYYAVHARIYDATRWTFLLGRNEILDVAVRELSAIHEPRILEAGCGTGRNLQTLGRRMPRASLTGVDVCAPMLARASKRLGGLGLCRAGVTAKLVRRPYDAPFEPGSHDLVLFSYALSMFNPGFEQALDAAYADLRPGGLIAVIDFHDTPSDGFRVWMRANHVRMEGHLLPELEARFAPRRVSLRRAWFGVWRHALFVGEKE